MQDVKLKIQFIFACVIGLSISNIAFAQADIFSWENMGIANEAVVPSGSQ